MYSHHVKQASNMTVNNCQLAQQIIYTIQLVIIYYGNWQLYEKATGH